MGMEFDTLDALVRRNLTIREIAGELGMSYSNVRHWLRKHGLKTRGHATHAGRYHCSCGETDPQEFYGHYRGMCRTCQNARVIAKGRDTRARALVLLGGKCVECGYDKYQAALDPHHVDPMLKDPAWRSMRGWSWVRVERELGKCVLLCANCHRGIHSGELRGLSANGNTSVLQAEIEGSIPSGSM